MRFFKTYLLVTFVLMVNFLNGQNYQAINGSVYAGSLSPGSNPASIVHVPYAWDITPFSVQFKQSTNAFRVEKYSLLSSPSTAEVKPENGIKRRFVFANQDIHLLNTRINLGPRAAIAFGANIRSYIYSTTSNANYQDSSYSLADFMKINVDKLPLSGEFTGSAWAEVYASFAHTIIDEGNRLLNAGVTLKVTRGLAGGYARARDVNYTPGIISGREGYMLTGGSLQYGYSSNFDTIDSSKTFAENRRVFLQRSFGGLSADVGFEYILLSGEENEGASDHAYRTKIGISVMDIGSNKYLHSSRSSLAIAGKANVNDTILENKFSAVTGIDQFNDSLAAIANSFAQMTGNFYVYQPTRLVINIDQHITNNFFVNAEMTLPVLSLAGKNTLYIKDLNLLAITPRWEIKSLGAYMPVLLNTRKQLWVGAAFKAGPLLLGTHNLVNMFSKNKAQVGGMYIAFTIRPGKLYERDDRNPEDKLTGRQKRRLDCPKF